jgi:hypothetical protein
VQLFQAGSGTVEIPSVTGAAKICDRRFAAGAGCPATAAGDVACDEAGATAGAVCAEMAPAKVRRTTNARSHVAFDISLLVRSACSR